MTEIERIRIGGLPVQLMTMNQSLQCVVEHVALKPARIFFVNAHCVTIAKSDPEYQQAVNHAEFVLNDGVGIEAAAKILGMTPPDNLNGTDWIPKLIDRLALRDDMTTLFFLGSKPEVVADRGGYFSKRWPHFQTVNFDHGYFADEAPILERIRKLRPQVLLVGMGVPKQELFIDRHWKSLVDSGVRLAIAGGAIFDFISGTLPRAPLWMRQWRLEWLYRLWIEPRRLWKRYLCEVFPFAWVVIQEWFNKKIRK